MLPYYIITNATNDTENIPCTAKTGNSYVKGLLT
jgi:hypothetical protein